MKAILVIDNVPNCCVACPFFEFINGDHNDCRTHCIAKLGLINDYGAEVRPSWCPLKPMPDKACEILMNALESMEKMKSVEVKVVRITE